MILTGSVIRYRPLSQKQMPAFRKCQSAYASDGGPVIVVVQCVAPTETLTPSFLEISGIGRVLTIRADLRPAIRAQPDLVQDHTTDGQAGRR